MCVGVWCVMCVDVLCVLMCYVCGVLCVLVCWCVMGVGVLCMLVCYVCWCVQGSERRGALLQYFHDTGTSKIPAVR